MTTGWMVFFDSLMLKALKMFKRFEAILELVDEVENQVERFRENVMSLVAEKSSLQSTLHTITQMISQSSDDMISMSVTNSTKDTCIQTAQGKSCIVFMILSETAKGPLLCL